MSCLACILERPLQRKGTRGSNKGGASSIRRMAMNRDHSMMDAHGDVTGVREADVGIQIPTVARPVPVPDRFPSPWMLAAMPVKEISLVHPPPGVSHVRSDELVFLFKPCALITCLDDFAVRHGTLGSGVAERIVNVATLWQMCRRNDA